MSERLNIKMVKDNNRTVIVVDGPTIERDQAVFQILSTYYGLTPQPAAEDKESSDVIPAVKGLSDISEPESTIPNDEEISKMTSYEKLYRAGELISGGQYHGLTAMQALERDKEVALVTLFSYAKSLPDSAEKKEIVKCCRQFMYDLPAIRNTYSSRDHKLSFLSNIAKMTPITTFINGYQDFPDFKQYAQDSEVETVFVAVTKALQDRSLRHNSVIQ